jgi:hypothetical protein
VDGKGRAIVIVVSLARTDEERHSSTGRLKQWKARKPCNQSQRKIQKCDNLPHLVAQKCDKNAKNERGFILSFLPAFSNMVKILIPDKSQFQQVLSPLSFPSRWCDTSHHLEEEGSGLLFLLQQTFRSNLTIQLQGSAIIKQL